MSNFYNHTLRDSSLQFAFLKVWFVTLCMEWSPYQQNCPHQTFCIIKADVTVLHRYISFVVFVHAFILYVLLILMQNRQLTCVLVLVIGNPQSSSKHKTFSGKRYVIIDVPVTFSFCFWCSFFNIDDLLIPIPTFLSNKACLLRHDKCVHHLLCSSGSGKRSIALLIF